MTRSPGRIISTTAAFIVLLFFFLPWVTVSCEDEDIDTLSGYDLSVGTDIDLGVGTEELDPDPIVFVVPLAAVAAIGLVILSTTGVLRTSLASAGQIAAASMGLTVLAFKWLDARNQTADYDFVSVSIEIGVWITVISFITIIIGAVLTRFTSAGSISSVPEESPP